MLSLRTMLDTEAAQGMEAEVVFLIGTARFTARLTNGTLPVTRGETETPDLLFKAPRRTTPRSRLLRRCPPPRPLACR